MQSLLRRSLNCINALAGTVKIVQIVRLLVRTLCRGGPRPIGAQFDVNENDGIFRQREADYEAGNSTRGTPELSGPHPSSEMAQGGDGQIDGQAGAFSLRIAGRVIGRDAEAAQRH